MQAHLRIDATGQLLLGPSKTTLHPPELGGRWRDQQEKAVHVAQLVGLLSGLRVENGYIRQRHRPSLSCPSLNLGGLVHLSAHFRRAKARNFESFPDTSRDLKSRMTGKSLDFSAVWKAWGGCLGIEKWSGQGNRIAPLTIYN